MPGFVNFPGCFPFRLLQRLFNFLLGIRFRLIYLIFQLGLGFFILFQFMKGKSFFTSDNIYYAKFDNVDGLEQSNPVSINGLKEGIGAGLAGVDLDSSFQTNAVTSLT